MELNSLETVSFAFCTLVLLKNKASPHFYQ